MSGAMGGHGIPWEGPWSVMESHRDSHGAVWVTPVGGGVIEKYVSVIFNIFDEESCSSGARAICLNLRNCFGARNCVCLLKFRDILCFVGHSKTPADSPECFLEVSESFLGLVSVSPESDHRSNVLFPWTRLLPTNHGSGPISDEQDPGEI